MSIFSIFTRAARKNYFHLVPAATPPAPTQDWPIVVDAEGNRVVDRPPAASDFLARLPVRFIDGGTIPVYQASPEKSREENIRDLVTYECRSEKNRTLLEQAVFLLSQTDDGRALLSRAHQGKFTFVFDAGRMEEEGAVGLCDYQNKQIPLAEGRTAVDVALTLKHELQHMVDIGNGMGYGRSETLKSATMADRALEGNARVSEAVAAAELLLGSPQGHPRQFRSTALFSAFWQKQSVMADMAHQALGQAAAGDWQAFAASVLPGYYQQKDTLDGYNQRYVKSLLKAVPDVSAYKASLDRVPHRDRQEYERYIDATSRNAETLFTRESWTPQKIASILTIKGGKYLEGLKNGFDIGSDQALAYSAKAVALLDKLKANIATVLPGVDKAAGMAIPVPSKEEKQPAPHPDPYARYQPPSEGAFQPIHYPDRVGGVRVTSGGSMNEYTVKTFAAERATIKTSGATEIDKVNYTVSGYLHNNSSNGNMMGLVSHLIDAGFRAPIGAFPDNYLRDLSGRMQMAMQAGIIGKGSPVSRQEVQLLLHWKEMAEKGLDPMWIDKDTKARSEVAGFRDVVRHGSKIVEALGTPAAVRITSQQALTR